MDENPHRQKFVEVLGDFPILCALMLILAILFLLIMDSDAYAQSIDSPSDAIPLSAFIGTWENNNSKGISKAVVQQLAGGPLQVHLFGACVPDYCDWGVVNATYADNQIESIYRFPFKTSSAALSLTNDGKLTVEVVNDFEDSIIGRSDIHKSVDILSRPVELGVVSNEPIRGVPYPITLSNNGTTEYDIEYKMTFSFLGDDNNYHISSVDKGAFDSYDILSEDTVIFYTRMLAQNENKSGIVVFQFGNGSAEKHRELGIDANVTSIPKSYYNNDIVGVHSPIFVSSIDLPPSNQTSSRDSDQLDSRLKRLFGPSNQTSRDSDTLEGLFGSLNDKLQEGLGRVPFDSNYVDGRDVEPPTPSGSISFTADASYFEVLISVVKIAPEVFKLAGDIYDKVTPCAALAIQDADADSGSPVVYKIDINNCSAHPQKVNLYLTPPSGQEISHLLSKRLFDISANRTDSSMLEIHVPASMPDNFYVFTMHADVIMNVFGKEFVVSSSLADESFQVNQARVFP